ncbi:hypothetical protein [Sphingobacterium suaedae]|uniref:Uncharacterized protein n=1 Tax=Sphingobacterium suaedae TaxID=1686402 RepID=A0ABW5KK60_9SPHI
MNKILLTFGTRPLAQRLGKVLASRYSCVFASSEPFPDVLLKQHYRRLPTGGDPIYVHELLKLCLDEGCQFILPLGKTELRVLLDAKILLEEYGIAVLIPNNLESCLVIENPPSDMQIKVIHEGTDLLTQQQITDSSFSGAGLLSDTDGEPILCLI